MGVESMLQTEEINQIRSSVDIVDVISNYLPLTQKGKNYFSFFIAIITTIASSKV